MTALWRVQLQYGDSITAGRIHGAAAKALSRNNLPNWPWDGFAIRPCGRGRIANPSHDDPATYFLPAPNPCVRQTGHLQHCEVPTMTEHIDKLRSTLEELQAELHAIDTIDPQTARIARRGQNRIGGGPAARRSRVDRERVFGRAIGTCRTRLRTVPSDLVAGCGESDRLAGADGGFWTGR